MLCNLFLLGNLITATDISQGKEWRSQPRQDSKHSTCSETLDLILSLAPSCPVIALKDSAPSISASLSDLLSNELSPSFLLCPSCRSPVCTLTFHICQCDFSLPGAADTKPALGNLHFFGSELACVVLMAWQEAGLGNQSSPPAHKSQGWEIQPRCSHLTLCSHTDSTTHLCLSMAK